MIKGGISKNILSDLLGIFSILLCVSCWGESIPCDVSIDVKNVQEREQRKAGHLNTEKLKTKEKKTMQKSVQKNNNKKDAVPVSKHVLSNGMTVLVRPVHTVPKVSIQLWYGVGSRDERDRERGIAHLIEHMIFKGTDKLSESDINVIAHMLSGKINAFTSHDYTGYLFNLPAHHWYQALPLMADCMSNCSFKADMLASEMKAVIQELKMYRDAYTSSLVDEMIGMIFAEHPYHHPIIGYKQDLWTVTNNDLRAFYKKHYVPNNATLVVVGDVQIDDVFKQAEKYFGAIPADNTYRRNSYYFNQDIVSKSVTLYREIKQPVVVYAFVIPGLKHKKAHLVSLLGEILGGSKSSRLYKKIVDELQLATSLQAHGEELFDHSLFFIACEPKDLTCIDQIQKCIQEECDAIAQYGVSDAELMRATKQARKDLYDLLENNENQAYEIGKIFLATSDAEYLFNALDKPQSALKEGIKQLVKDYFNAPLMHRGLVVPLAEKDRDLWIKNQQASDFEDNRILDAHIRTTDVEAPSYAKNISVKEQGVFDFPKPSVFTLPNNLKVFSYNNTNTPKINVVLDLRVDNYYDPEDQEGLVLFMSKMLSEGTQKYPGRSFLDVAQDHGISISTSLGAVSMDLLAEELPFALDLLVEMLTKASFSNDAIEQVRAQLLASLRNFWDQPQLFSNQLIREKIYGVHQYSKNSLGTIDSITNLTRDDLLRAYREFVSPEGARLAIVGDLTAYDFEQLIKEKLANWSGSHVSKIKFLPIKPVAGQKIDYPINRDQVVLTFAVLSVDRKHKDFDKLLLFDQIFGGGLLRSMSSRLFDLREQSGLFYTISGSLVSGAGEQPGMFLIRTIVSLDRLKEAQDRIKKLVDTVVDTITNDELCEARRAILSASLDYFASNKSIAEVFLFLDKYELPWDFYDKRAQMLNAISLEEVKAAVKQFMKSENLVELRVGRV